MLLGFIYPVFYCPSLYIVHIVAFVNCVLLKKVVVDDDDDDDEDEVLFLSASLLSHRCNKSSSGGEIPERDVTYHLLCLLIYH